MEELRLNVPTFDGYLLSEQVRKGTVPELGPPLVPVLIREAEGVRVVLGSHDFEDMEASDIQIERRPKGWAIFLHPVGGSDASGYVYFLDDGRSFLLPDGGFGPTPEIEIVNHMKDVPDIDTP